MSKQEKLIILRQMLSDYKISRFIPNWFRILFNLETDHGLCAYLIAENQTAIGGLPELLMAAQKLYPDNHILFSSSPYGRFWFKRGKTRPRIKIIKQAIKIIEETL